MFAAGFAQDQKRGRVGRVNLAGERTGDVTDLQTQYEHDKSVWDACAQAYESAIVLGHPDVTAYEHFEEDLLDRILVYLIRDSGRCVHLHDVACGSGRLHLRYGLKSLDPSSRDPESVACRLQTMHANFQYSPSIAPGLKRVSGIDFSGEMLALARRKLKGAGLADLLDARLFFEQGSAFDLAPFPDEPLPVVVTLCNSIGVMQGLEGACKLFQAMRRSVEAAGGVAIISGYCNEAARDFALGNYESVLDACGQPDWLEPATFASRDYQQRPHAYKRAYDGGDTLVVGVYDNNNAPVKPGHVLRRMPERVAETIATGHIRTYYEYESHWYSSEQFRAWISEWWDEKASWHIAGSDLDALRAAPAQLAIYDPADRLRPFFKRLGIVKGVRELGEYAGQSGALWQY